jgi:hypothetical protein
MVHWQANAEARRRGWRVITNGPTPQDKPAKLEKWKSRLEKAGLFAEVDQYTRLLASMPKAADQRDAEFVKERIATLSAYHPLHDPLHPALLANDYHLDPGYILYFGEMIFLDEQNATALAAATGLSCQSKRGWYVVGRPLKEKPSFGPYKRKKDAKKELHDIYSSIFVFGGRLKK